MVKKVRIPPRLFWAHGNYVGPYWSDGKIQSSVVWGNKEPTDALDALARQHDAAHAHYKDRPHREAADALFAEEARKLTQKYGKGWAADPKVAATLVQYGNYATRQAAKLGEYTKYGTSGMVGNLIGAARFGIGNLLDAGKMVTGTYLKQEKNDVSKFYGTDPKKQSVSERRRSLPGRAGVLRKHLQWYPCLPLSKLNLHSPNLDRS